MQKAPDTKRDIAALRDQSRKALDSALERLTSLQLKDSIPGLQEIREARAKLDALRLEVDAALTVPLAQHSTALSPQWLAINLALIVATDRLSTRVENELTRCDPFIADMVLTNQLAWAVRTYPGRDRVRIANAIAGDHGMTRER